MSRKDSCSLKGEKEMKDGYSRKHCILIDRGVFAVDMILKYTEWFIDVLVVDSNEQKTRYMNAPRIEHIYSMPELLLVDDIYDLKYKEIEKYKKIQPLADTGFRRICDDYSESHYDFYTSICFWNRVFDTHDVDVCLILGLLHGFKCDAILQEMSVQRGIPCFNITNTIINTRAIYNCNHEELLCGEQSTVDVNNSTHYMASFEWDGDFKTPIDGKDSKIVNKFIWKRCYSMFGMVGVRVLWRMTHPNKEYIINYRPYSVTQYVMASIQSYLIQRRFESYAIQPDYTKPYVVFYLHDEPEAAVQGHENVVDSQLLMVRMLAESLPMGWKVYVKRHPDVEHMNTAYLENYVIPQVVFHSKLFYSKLISMKNVYLLSQNVSRTCLFENTKAVATIAGTVVLEAIDARKPVLLFGAKNTVYYHCDDIFFIDSLASCQAALKCIASGFSPSYRDFEEQCQRYLFPETDEGWKQILQTIENYVG